MEAESLDVEKSKSEVKIASRFHHQKLSAYESPKRGPFDSPARGPTLSTSTSSFEVNLLRSKFFYISQKKLMP